MLEDEPGSLVNNEVVPPTRTTGHIFASPLEKFYPGQPTKVSSPLAETRYNFEEVPLKSARRRRC